ncbi:MAG: RNA polymerase sigma-70 factor [Cyclobacteriaceae bacterium]
MDTNGFKRIFFDHYHSLFNSAFRVLRSSDAAEDTVQDVFTKFWANRNRIMITTSVEAYLRKAVINASLNYLEKHGRVVPLDTLVDQQEPADFNTPVYSDVSEQIDKAIDKLPARCRAVFCLSRHEGLSNQEIADQLGISKRTVENQLGNALLKLRKYLKPLLTGVSAVTFTFF